METIYDVQAPDSEFLERAATLRTPLMLSGFGGLTISLAQLTSPAW
jgi:hypothetical protein